MSEVLRFPIFPPGSMPPPELTADQHIAMLEDFYSAHKPGWYDTLLKMDPVSVRFVLREAPPDYETKEQHDGNL